MPANDEPDIARGGGWASRVAQAITGNRKVGNATRVGAKVSLDGINSLTTGFDSFLKKLKEVRKELVEINKLTGTALPSGSTISSGGAASMQKFQDMTQGFKNLSPITGSGGSGPATPSGGGNRSSGGGLMDRLEGGFLSKVGTQAAVGITFDAMTDRFTRNMKESVGISQSDMLTSSMYSKSQYKNIESARLGALGSYAGTRQDAAAAQQIGLGYGLTKQNSMDYLKTTANVVQAMGGTATAPQAAAVAGGFIAPSVLRRAISMGITPGMKNGVITNPLTQATKYIDDYEKRNKITLNLIDFGNMRNPGNGTRYNFQRLYGLSDDALDTVVQAGMQNLQFKGASGTNTGTGSNISFESSADLNKLGLSTNKLGLSAFKLMSTTSKREANFFNQQEGSMVGRQQTEESIQNALGSVESALRGVIGPLNQFGRYLEIAGTVLAGSSLIKALGGGGGGGGVVGAIGNVLGRGTAPAGQAASKIAGMASVGETAGVGAYAASISSAPVFAAGVSTAGAVAIAALPIAAAVAGGLILNANKSREVKKKEKVIVSETDEELIKNLNNGTGSSIKGWWYGTSGESGGYTATLNVFQKRRGALVASMLEEARDAKVFDKLPLDKKSTYDSAINIFTGNQVTDNQKFGDAKYKAGSFIALVKKENPSLYAKYFGDVADPFDMKRPVTTQESRDLVTSKEDTAASTWSGATPTWSNSGDPQAGQSTLPGGIGQSDPGVANASGPTWANLDSRMKTRLDQLFKASGGRVYLGKGGGWRSSDAQRTMFLSRYSPDPNGEVTWQGRRYKHTSGAPAAPPGLSNHEIGLAADVAGDLGWVAANAGKYGLKTISGLGEPWHVQLAELANGFAGTAASDSGTSTGASTGASASTGGTNAASAATGGGWGGNTAQGVSGINYSMAAAMQLGASMAGAGGSGSWGGVAGASTANTSGITPGKSGAYSVADATKMAYAAGFRGQDLINVVAIMGRESHYDPSAHNTNASTGDNSYGLMQINMLGSLGPARLKQFGLSNNDQLLDGPTNLAAAFKMYQGSGLTPWGAYKGVSNTHGTDNYMQGAIDAVQQTGLGGSGDPMPGGRVTNVTVHAPITIHSKGEQYDGELLGAHLGSNIRIHAKRDD